ncbi:MAG: cation-transporting P-type ATPase [Cyanobacteriota bacterium]|nr:cation-transporting P-type ATPase [Cyanobacteriota bacterium]
MTPSEGHSAVSPWHTLSLPKLLQQLQTDPEKGLSTAEVGQRQEQYGANQLEASRGRSNWQVLLDQFTNIMLLMLLGVAIVSAWLDLREGSFPKDAIAILAIVGLNGALGYLQESRAEKALAALKKLASPVVKVRRDGKLQEVPAVQLVPGDLVSLEAGVQIPADGRLWEAVNLQIREAALTGEAVAVTKQVEADLDPETPLGDRLNMAFQGTEVMQGRGTLVVTQIGMQTELGKIANLLQSVENEPTPLQRRMDQLGNVLVSGSLVLVALVVVGGILRTGNFSIFTDLLEISLSMAVAVVPEGLPAVITVTLAIGTQRMVRRHALIRRLPAVETLGSVTTICSDKTGTLTENKMVVTSLETPSAHYHVTGTGYLPEGEFYQQQQRTDPTQSVELSALLVAGVLCNDALLQPTSNPQESAQVWGVLGDPTEGALLAVAGKAKLFKSEVDTCFPRKAEIPFSSERKRMSVVVSPTGEGNSPLLLFCKGSPELVLERCSQIFVQGEHQPLTDTQCQEILAANNALAGQGIRVLGFATRELADLPTGESQEFLEAEMTWLGLIGMRDAPRREAREAVAQCREAGIRPIMITGDHQLTAIAIARDLGIVGESDRAVEGKALNHMTPQQLKETVKTVSVYARVAPEHKLRIVQALQEQDQFVAMTGDGVNDAPALKQADIGVAMGITGTDVSKEASDMVLLDDNFATIVAAVEEGRLVYSNIRRFIKYILGSNIGEVLTIAAAPLLGLGGVPLTPLQILWMNLVTDGLPALALAMEPAEAGIMQRPPFDPKESIFSRGLGSYMLRVGIVFAVITITMMVWMAPLTSHWQTMVFTTLCIAQMGHALAVRSTSKLLIEINPFTNLYLLWAVGLTILLQVALLYVPFLSRFFGTDPLTGAELLICVGFSLLVLLWIEIEKLVIRWLAPKGGL